MRKHINRRVLSNYQITDYINNDKPIEEKASLPRDFFQYRPKLYQQLVIPSFVHGYSLAIEYMRDWFLGHFENKNYFKSININGRHVMDEWKHFNKLNIVREKPMLAIVPTVEYDHDRETIDVYHADRRLLLHKSNYQQSFFKDWKSMSFLYADPRELKMNFSFKIRVGSRAEQLDLWKKMELYFRIGASETNYVSQDMHIPHELISALATANGFELDNNGEVKDVMSFIAYCNEHSDMPIIFKMRAINQKPEYFLRTNNCRVHIITRDKIQLDDGEKEGRLDSNFHIEMQAVVHMIIPHFYVFFSQQPIEQKITVGHEGIGIYSINAIEIPPENARGWGQIVQTNYLCDEGDTEIDLSTLFSGNSPLAETMRYNLKNFISPDSFIQVVIYRSDIKAILVQGWMDYKKLSFNFNDPIDHETMLTIVVYADKGYINDTVSMLHNYNTTRIENS